MTEPFPLTCRHWSRFRLPMLLQLTLSSGRRSHYPGVTVQRHVLKSGAGNMKVLIVIFLLWMFMLTLLLGVAVGVGLFLEWLLGVDRGSAVVVGIVSITCATYLLMRLMSLAMSSQEAKLSEDELTEDFFFSPKKLRYRTRKSKP